MGDVLPDPRDERDLLVAEVGLAFVADERDAAPAQLTCTEDRAELGAESERASDFAIARAAGWFAASVAVQGADRYAPREQVTIFPVVPSEQLVVDKARARSGQGSGPSVLDPEAGPQQRPRIQRLPAPGAVGHGTPE